MYKIDRRGRGPGLGVQKSFTRTDPLNLYVNNDLKLYKTNFLKFESSFLSFNGK